MAEFRPTPGQKLAIEDTGGEILVSAAAGSGKTRVLTERLLRLVEQGADIDAFLVITFTKAAAAELRARISDALGERARRDGSKRLRRQAALVQGAQIGTIHGFCAAVLREFAHEAGVSPDFAVADEDRASELRALALERALDEGYERAEADFLALADTVGAGRDDRRLAELILRLYDKLQSHARPEDWARGQAGLLAKLPADALDTPWGAELMRSAQDTALYWAGEMDALIQRCAGDERLEKAYVPSLSDTAEGLRRFAAEGELGWDEARACLPVPFPRIGRFKGASEDEEALFIKARRESCKKAAGKLAGLFAEDSAKLLGDLARTAGPMRALLALLLDFDRRYAAEKRRRSLVDYADLEHMAARLLTDADGRPTRAAREISRRFDGVMVDEYQDVSRVQDLIIRAVSREGRDLFMVGDVKQSIYRFRLADPGLFLQKYEAYPDEADAQPGEPRKILLSENFRSRPEILAACNQVFSLVMRRRVGGLDYTAREALRPGRSFPPLPDCPVELHCLTHTGAVAPEKSRAEAQFVAGRIREMLAAGTPVTEGEGLRPMRPGDVVILMRSLSSTANVYLEALSQAGIPAVCDRGGSLLETSEVQILLALLQLIDNPHQDIPLLTVLASPVFGFTPEQLAKPRTKERREDLFDAITAYGGDFAPFLELLEALREDAKWMRLQELMESIFRRTGFLSVFAAMDDGLGRERNLLAFESFVISFEQGGAKALPDLLWYLQELQESGGQLPVPKAGGGDAVRLMTIHSSKGLEFPVVFLADLSRKFNLQDMREAILVDSDLALGCNRVDTARFVRYPTLAKSAIVRKKTAEAVSEELRVLYVAMTRAKDRLVMTYYSRRLQQELKNLASQLTMPPSEELCAAATCPGHWILLSALCRTEAGALFALSGESPASQVWADTWRITAVDLAEYEAVSQAETAAPPPPTPDLEGLALLAKSYPHLEAAAIPAKVTATQLKGRVPDQEAAEGAVVKAPPDFSFRRPSFLPHKLTPAERGVATHLFMQFARYERLTTPSGIAAERQRLLEEAFLTAEQLEAVDEKAVLAFFTAPLGQWLLSQEKVRREFKFSLLVDAAEVGYQVEGETLMLQGVVDCFVVEPDGLTILDFKTDRVGEKTIKARAQDYTPQIRAYGKALSTIYHLPVKRLILYFFATGTAVEVEA